MYYIYLRKTSLTVRSEDIPIMTEIDSDSDHYVLKIRYYYLQALFVFFFSQNIFFPSLSHFESRTHHCVISEMYPLLFRLRYLTGTHTSRVTEVT